MIAVAGLALLLAAMPPVSAEPDTAPAAGDSTLHRYLQTLSDSTDRYFGPVAAGADTAGLDSARAYALVHGDRWPHHARNKLTLLPWVSFNRVDGPVLGAAAWYGRAQGRGELRGSIGTATGPNLMLGRLAYTKQIGPADFYWRLRIAGGRETVTMDRERTNRAIAALAGFFAGEDHNHYLRRDGMDFSVSHEGVAHGVTLAYRDMLESPRSVTATWNLFGHDIAVADNIPAQQGRAREISLDAELRVPRTPVYVQALGAASGAKIGSDFGYRRTRIAAGADLGITRWLSFVPQAEYGALNRDALPQESFYLGGNPTLRSLPSGSLGGTRLALARGELVLTRDLFALLGSQRRSSMPVLASVFGGTGAAWGHDPFGGPDRPGGDWPDDSEWRSEVGTSLLYQPGVPEPTDFLRISIAWPVGAHSGGSRVSVAFGRAMDLLRPFER